MRVAKQWDGMDFLAKIERAAGRSIVSIGVHVAVETKRVTHVGESGNLRRSVHAAPPDADHSNDEERAAQGDMQMFTGFKPGDSALGPVVEVGSWLDYACVEWVGRGHPGLQQGLEAVRGAKADAIVYAAFREEGLAGR